MTSGADWQGRTALVIGSSGFIGGGLCSRLHAEGARVIAFSRWNGKTPELVQGEGSGGEITYIEGSIADRPLMQQTMQSFGVDTVFHLAGQAKISVGERKPVETFEANVQGTWNVLEAAVGVEQNIRVLLASTEVVYSKTGKLPYTEESALDVTSPYVASKICAEVLARCYFRTYGLPVCVARMCNVYGGGDTSFERIIPGTICALLRGEFPVIQSNGLAEREYLYVDDAISAYIQLAGAMDDRQIWGEIFNFSSGKPVSVMTLVETILKLMGRMEVKPKVLGKLSDGGSVRHMSCAKARSLGWEAETALETGLQKAIAWYEAHANELITEVAS